MKPYPLASLNHFTFPLAIRAASYEVNRSCTAWCRASQPTCGALYRLGGFFCQVVSSLRVRFGAQAGTPTSRQRAVGRSTLQTVPLSLGGGSRSRGVRGF